MNISKNLYITSSGEIVDEASEDHHIHLYVDSEERVFAEYFNDHTKSYSGPLPPGNFGLLLRGLKKKALSVIREFLKEVYLQPHLIEVYEICKPHLNPELNKEAYLESMGSDGESPDDEDIETFGRLYIACYPIFASLYPRKLDYCYDGFYGVVAGYSVYFPHLSETTFKGFVKELFGVWRKDAAKAVAESNPEMIEFIASLKESDILTIEQYIYILEMHKKVNSEIVDINSFSKLNVLTNKTFFRLIGDLISNELSYYEIRDTIEMVEICGKSKRYRAAKSWDDLHEIAMNLAPDIKFANTIKLIEDFEKIIKGFNALESDITLKPMLDAKVFNYTGMMLNICIGKGSYFRNSLAGDGYCFNIWKDKEIYGALEIIKVKGGTWVVRQISGNSNKKIPEEAFIRENLTNLMKVLNEGKEINKNKSNIPERVQLAIDEAHARGNNVVLFGDELIYVDNAQLAQADFEEDIDEDAIPMEFAFDLG